MKHKKAVENEEDSVLEKIEFHMKCRAGILREIKDYIGNQFHNLEDEDGNGAEDEVRELSREMNLWLERQAPALLGLCKLEAEVAQLRRDLWTGLADKVTHVLQSSRSAHSRSYAQWRIGNADRVLKARAFAPIRFDDVLEERRQAGTYPEEAAK
jgi:hypothetical protein